MAAAALDEVDLEKQTQNHHHDGSAISSVDDSEQPPSRPLPAASHGGDDPGAARVLAIREGNSVLRFLGNLESRIDKLTKFEATGVERVTEDQRRPPQILNMVFFWFSLLFNLTLVPIGMLGPIFGISVNNSIILTIFSTIIGSTIPAFTATLSPPTGLRQIAVSRYSLGIWGAKLCSILNILINVGYGVIGSIVSGQLVRAVSGGKVSLVVGIIVVVVIAYAVSFFGFTLIHHYERYAWTLALVLLCVLYGQSHQYFTPTPGMNAVSGATLSGACLTYFAIIFGVCASWCPIAGDYYVHYPANTNKWMVFGLTYVGLTVPTIFVGILGNYFGGIIFAHANLSKIYGTEGVGGLILAVMSPPTAWAKFACIIFVLTHLANLICNIYSSALSIQLLGKHFIAVPRFAWCTLLAIVTFALAYGGRHVLEKIINNLLSMLGYWTFAFAAILFIEHFWFRPGLGGYDLTAWQDPSRLPPGWAGTTSLLIGIGFSFLGMCQTWYVAPIAKLIGAHGGDIGDELTLISVVISYPLLRTLEIKHYGR